MAANLLIEQQISATHTTRVVRVVVAASPLPAVVLPPSVEPVTAPPVKAVSPNSLIAAIEHYEAAVRGHSDINDADSERRLASAAGELEREAHIFIAQSEIVHGSVLDRLRARLAEYRSRGAELARVADLRKKTLDELRARFDAMDARTKASLADSWKIFGRVVARKSLVDLNSSLDEIRRGFANLPATGLYDHGALGTIIASEKALAASLETNQAALTRSQGEAWVMQMHGDLAQIGTLEDAVTVLDVQRRDSEAKFAQETRSLVALAGAAAPEATPQSSARQSRVSVSPGSDGLADGGTPPEPLGEHATETSSTTVSKPASATLIFWVSVGVLLLLLLISKRTVMSVVGPVRRMRAVTLKIAGGAAGVQVARGGIRELDDLALSFNTMAA